MDFLPWHNCELKYEANNYYNRDFIFILKRGTRLHDLYVIN